MKPEELHPDTSAQTLEESQAEKAGAKVRKRNAIISVIFFVLFFGGMYWAMKSGLLADTDQIRHFIEKTGAFGPIVFILISVFTSYIPVVPLGSMGSVGIVLFGVWPAFIYNSITSVINCLIAFFLAKKYGYRILLMFAAPKTVEKYRNWLQKSKHFELFFFICMLLPVSPDLVLCMIAGMTGMKFSHFLIIILVSRPVSSFCYSNGLLRVFDWLAKAIHLG